MLLPGCGLGKKLHLWLGVLPYHSCGPHDSRTPKGHMYSQVSQESAIIVMCFPSSSEFREVIG